MRKIHCLALMSCLIAFPISLTAGNADGQTPPSITQPQRQLTGLPAEIEKKARQITVRIDEVNANANGSGFIIAKEGNTYTVLTAAHVVKNQASTFEILAPDGKRYPVEESTIKIEEGVDLAVVQFTSTENYQVATLAGYNTSNFAPVFLGGYPKLGQKDPKWRFEAGFVFEKEQGIIQAGSLSLETNNLGLASSSPTFAGGYELVYTNISYAGMSGAPVLDSQGRVIGTHGSVEGEYVDDESQQEFVEIQLGYSLGISINTFLGIAQRLGVKNLQSIETTSPPPLNQQQQQSIREAILGVEVPHERAPTSEWLARGNQLWRLLQYDEAVKAFDRAIQLGNSDLTYLAMYGKGLALFDQTKYEEAAAVLERAISYKPNFYSALKLQSAVLRESNQLEKALVAIDKAISIRQNDATLYSEKGGLLNQLKRYSQAENAFKQAIKFSPRAAFYNNRGILFADQLKWDLALADFNQAIQLNPNYAEAYYNRGIVNKNQLKWDLALSNFNQAIQLNPNYAEAYIHRGNLYYDQLKWDLALADFNQAIQLNPNYALAYNNRGLLYADQQKWDLALADYDRAIQLNSRLADAYGNRGILYKNQKKWDLTLADLNQAIQLNPTDAETYGNRGIVRYQIGDKQGAIQDIQTAADLFYQQQKMADYQKAMEILQKLQG